MPLSDTDRDMMTRTIIGEAGDQPPEGQAAIAHVIMTRAKSGKYGKTPTEVVLAPGQFEPWQTRSRELSSISPKSKQYQRVARIVDGVASGEIPDPTNGASHFLDEEITRARRGGTLPDWAQGQGVKIGDHTFHYPDKKAAGGMPMPLSPNAGGVPPPQTAPDAITTALGGSGGQSEALPGPALQYADDNQPKPVATMTVAPSAEPNLLDQFTPRGEGVPPAAPVQASQEVPNLLDQFTPRPTPEPASAPKVEQPVSAESPGLISGIVRSAGEGVPLIGGLLNKANAATYAALSPLLPGDKTVSQASTWSERYRENLKRETGKTKSFEKEHPYISTAANVAGGVGATLPLAATKIGSTALGLVGKTLPQRVLAGSAAGGVLGGADAALRGNDPATGAMVGSSLGAVGPIVGKAVGAAVEKAKPLTNALSEIIKRVQNPAEAAARLKANPKLQLVDVEAPIRTAAQGLIGKHPEAHGIIDTAMTARSEGAKEAVKDAYGTILGPPKDMVKFTADLKQQAKDVGTKAINPALEGAKPVDVSSVLAKIDERFDPVTLKALREGKPPPGVPLDATEQKLWSWRRKLAGTEDKSRLTDPNKLHDIQSAMRTEAETLMRAGGTDKLIGHELYQVRETLKDAIDASAGGKYRPALEKYKDEFDIQDALERGMGILENPRGAKGLESRPEAMAERIKNYTPAELEAEKEGARDAYRQAIKSIRGAARKGMDLPEIDVNREKMELLFGKKEADTLLREMRDMRDMAESHSKILHNSKTAETLAAQKSIAPREVTPVHMMQGGGPFGPFIAGPLADLAVPAMSGYGTMIGTAVGGSVLAGKIGTNLVQRLGQNRDIARNTPFARLITDARGKERNALISLLEQQAKVKGLPKSPENPLASIISRGATPALRRTTEGYPYFQASPQEQSRQQ